MLDVVTFKWRPVPGYRSKFESSAVNVLKNMVKRHYRKEHRFSCITDDPRGLDPDVRPIPLWKDFGDIPAPHGLRGPSCYRRLKAFSADMKDVIGPRFVCMDLDTVITGDLSSVWDRPEDFVIWGETDPRSWYNGSMWMMTAGARRQVYDKFDPKKSPQQARAAGRFGSDQGWISHCLGKGETIWTIDDGVYSFGKHVRHLMGELPRNAKVVMFHGLHDPWSPFVQQNFAFVREFYR